MKAEQIKAAFDETRTDKGYTHGYDRLYGEIFASYTPSSLLELGVMQGRSIAAWKIIFPSCDITGVDISDKKFSKPIINFADSKIIIGDCTKPEILDKLDTYDVIVDDASHFYKDIIRSFIILKDRFKYAYVIEDAMYHNDFVIEMIRRQGFSNIVVYDSKVSGVPVSKSKVTQKKGHKGQTVVDLKMIVVYRS